MRLLRLIRYLPVLLLIALLSGCPAGSSDGPVPGDGTLPATPPAPPVELPSILIFPGDVNIPLDKIQRESTPGALQSFKAIIGEGPLTDQIALGPDLIDVVTLLTTNLFRIINAIEIPVTTDPAPLEISTTFEEGVPAQISIDFGDYDHDNDGATEGCSGCTCAVGCLPSLNECPTSAPAEQIRPICMRITVSAQPVGEDEVNFKIPAVFSFPPSTDNIGAGRIKIAQTEDELTFNQSIIYDHQNPDAKRTEIFHTLQGTINPSVADIEQNLHAIIEQDGSDSAGKKHVTAAIKDNLIVLLLELLTGAQIPTPTIEYIGQFFEGTGPESDFWSGSENVELDFSNLPPDFEFPEGFDLLEDFKDFIFTNVCAQISTATAFPSTANCDDLGISVGDEPFIDLATPIDVAFPDDF